MEEKVLLYDSNGVKIGETFVRRAKQLVRQQRAVWIDDKQNALRFAPGMEYKDTVPVEDIVKESGSFDSNVTTSDEGWLRIQTEKRLKERKRFVKHSFTFVTGFIVMGIIITFVNNKLPYVLYYDSIWAESVNMSYYEYQFELIREIAITFFYLISIVWTAAYIVHVYLYATSKRATKSIKKRLTKQLATLKNA